MGFFSKKSWENKIPVPLVSTGDQPLAKEAGDTGFEIVLSSVCLIRFRSAEGSVPAHYAAAGGHLECLRWIHRKASKSISMTVCSVTAYKCYIRAQCLPPTCHNNSLNLKKVILNHGQVIA